MKRLVCETCGGTDLVKDGETYVCKRCGSRYAAHEQKVVVTVVDQRGDDKSQSKDKNQNPAQDKAEKPSGIKETNPAIRSIVYDASRTFRANEYGNYYGGGAIEAAEKLDGYADKLSALDANGGFEWYVRASSAYQRSTVGNDHFEEAIDFADRAFRIFMGLLPEITDLEFKALADIFDFPARLLSTRVYVHVKESADEVDARALDLCLGAWQTKVSSIYSSWNRDYIVKGKMPKELSSTLGIYYKANADSCHKIRLAFDVLTDMRRCDGMIRRSCATDLSNELEDRFRKEQDAFRAESRRIRDELFGSKAVSAERALFERHASALDDLERWSREVTRMLEGAAENIDAFVSCFNSHGRSMPHDKITFLGITGSRQLIYQSAADSIRFLMAKRDDCAQHVATYSSSSAKQPSWIVGEDERARLDAQIDELKGPMREYYRDDHLKVPLKTIRYCYGEAADELARIEKEMAALRSAPSPADYDGMATDLSWTNEREDEIVQVRQELHSTGFFDFGRRLELISRIHEIKRSISSRKMEIDRRLQEEKEAFETYRCDKLGALESKKTSAQKDLQVAKSEIDRRIDKEFVDESSFFNYYYGLPRSRYNRFYHPVRSDELF